MGRVGMNWLGRMVLNSPLRALAQRRCVLPAMCRLGGSLKDCQVLEIGCGRGYGVDLLVGSCGAGAVVGIDIDPVMVRLASRRSGGRALVSLGDMVQIGAPSYIFDAVVDMGAVHLEPRWREALAEVQRVLKPGGRFYFEEIVRPRRQVLATLATGRWSPMDFTRAGLLDELARLGFTVVALQDVVGLALTGMVGDVIGVARTTCRIDAGEGLRSVTGT